MHHFGLAYVLLKQSEVVLNGPQQAVPNGPVEIYSIPLPLNLTWVEYYTSSLIANVT